MIQLRPVEEKDAAFIVPERVITFIDLPKNSKISVPTTEPTVITPTPSKKSTKASPTP